MPSGLIVAAVTVMIAGFALAIGYLWGAHDAREGMAARMTSQEQKSLGLAKEEDGEW